MAHGQLLIRLAAASLLALALSGCVGAVIEGSSAATDMAKRDGLEASAAGGNAEAQYKLGETYCCRVGLKMGVYDNDKATAWMCKAADQGYGQAEYRLAEIYSGSPFTYRLMRRVGTAIKGAPTNIPVALVWAERARDHRVDGAKGLLKSLRKHATPAERARAADLKAGGQVPCRWHETIGE